MKHPYYYWYASDFLGSSFVQGLDLDAECCYRRLLDVQATSDDHRIPDDSETLRKQCKRPPVAQWNKIWLKLKVKFQPHPDGHGGLVNIRLYERLQEAADYAEKKSRAGKLGMESRYNKEGNKRSNKQPNKEDNKHHNNDGNEVDNKHLTSISISKEEETPIVPLQGATNKTVNKTRTKAKNPGSAEYSADFEAWWTLYPRKTGKYDCWLIWQRIRPTPTLQAKMIATLDWQRHCTDWTKDHGDFIPHPATWLNQGRWDDEPTEASGRPPSVHDFL